jgi:L-alanine-DL-glutamate epimerase-like enolase superfamily enzyme
MSEPRRLADPIVSVDAVRVHVPYVPPVGPYVSRTGETLGATSLVVRIETRAAVGWGEGSGELPEVAGALLVGQDAAEIDAISAALIAAGVPVGPRSAVDMALWDARGQRERAPLHRLLRDQFENDPLVSRPRTEIELCGCMGLQAPRAAGETARQLIQRWGFRHLKTKAGRAVAEDLAVGRAVLSAAGAVAALRPDANGGYSPAEAEPLLRELHLLGVAMFEDPCDAGELAAMAHLREAIGIGIAINMAVSDAASAREVLRLRAADLLMPDTDAAGSIAELCAIADAAAAAGVPCLMHCAHDLGVKTAAMLHVAAAVPNWAPGSDTTYHGLADDILTERFVIRNGRLPVPGGAGLGVTVDPAKLARYPKHVT